MKILKKILAVVLTAAVLTGASNAAGLNMETAKGVMETARLINEIGSRSISSMHKIVESEIQKTLESEGL